MVSLAFVLFPSNSLAADNTHSIQHSTVGSVLARSVPSSSCSPPVGNGPAQIQDGGRPTDPCLTEQRITRATHTRAPHQAIPQLAMYTARQLQQDGGVYFSCIFLLYVSFHVSHFYKGDTGFVAMFVSDVHNTCAIHTTSSSNPPYLTIVDQSVLKPFFKELVSTV